MVGVRNVREREMIKKLNNSIVPSERIITESGNVIWKYWNDSFCRVVERSGGVVGSKDRAKSD